MILVKETYSCPSINGIVCTYKTKKIRSEIEQLWEKNNKEFILPDKFKFDIVPSSFWGQVAKIDYNGKKDN